MKLEKIFRHDERRVFEALAEVNRNHKRLREKFEQFVKGFQPGEIAFPSGTEFFPEPEKPLLTVKFCGKRFRFCYDTIDGGERGQVRCMAASTIDLTDSGVTELEVGRFTFNRDGYTDISPPGSNGADLLNINDGSCAFAIVACFLVAGFDEDMLRQ